MFHNNGRQHYFSKYSSKPHNIQLLSLLLLLQLNKCGIELLEAAGCISPSNQLILSTSKQLQDLEKHRNVQYLMVLHTGQPDEKDTNIYSTLGVKQIRYSQVDYTNVISDRNMDPVYPRKQQEFSYERLFG
ncbi:hypothetical protein AMECASPLE_038954 [Ameca splendens]|uniref:Uncharacterized protein n=1 Tax=Ameca splendens TaxID=208324 RepID=A0ABV0Z6K0_9TELE